MILRASSSVRRLPRCDERMRASHSVHRYVRRPSRWSITRRSEKKTLPTAVSSAQPMQGSFVTWMPLVATADVDSLHPGRPYQEPADPKHRPTSARRASQDPSAASGRRPSPRAARRGRPASARAPPPTRPSRRGTSRAPAPARRGRHTWTSSPHSGGRPRASRRGGGEARPRGAESGRRPGGRERARRRGRASRRHRSRRPGARRLSCARERTPAVPSLLGQLLRAIGFGNRMMAPSRPQWRDVMRRVILALALMAALVMAAPVAAITSGTVDGAGHPNVGGSSRRRSIRTGPGSTARARS